ncbi:uncharacterized protein LOC130824265 [Amaranthus tricolor]|uniref:uncharacterized protein LOC130824265 n=1 Tax=Amaranthus tricolor TaxID=29722 RepID=UPI0025876BA5|nr:uncharacterized protein LOC130824265 [Amaranthus tricolor]
MRHFLIPSTNTIANCYTIFPKLQSTQNKSMKTILLKSQLFLHSLPLKQPITKTLIPNSSSFHFPNPINPPSKTQQWLIKSHKEEQITVTSSSGDDDHHQELRKRSIQVITGAASIGLLMLLMGQDKAWALGPEGPLMEEFWENVRRYALYALTVSTGAVYTLFQPIIELLKNPISALLIVIIFVGSFFIVSQILSAMVGVSEFSYEYAY